MWAFKGWLGSLYPLRANPSDFLKLYGARLTTVEGNTTFYAIPSQETVRKWAAEMPDGFHFCPKLPRALTHEGPLRRRAAEGHQFQGRMLPLGARLGPSFLQLPPDYGPDLLPDLGAFLTHGWDLTASPLAVEVRHPAWFEGDNPARLDACLRRHRAGRVCLDARPVYECPPEPDPFEGCERRKPHLPVKPTVTAPYAFIRYISHPILAWNEGYLHQWASWIERRIALGTRIYFFVHCPQEAQSPNILRHFQRALEARAAPIPPLPWDQVKATDAHGQFALF
jgi:uncharacterized protein YecE (DUF72 family)